MGACFFCAGFAGSRGRGAHRDYPPGAAHGDAGAQSRAGPLCAAHRTNRFSRETSARLSMADAEYSSRKVRGVQDCEPENTFPRDDQELTVALIELARSTRDTSSFPGASAFQPVGSRRIRMLE